MIKEKDLQKVKKEISTFKKALKQIQKDIIRVCDTYKDFPEFQKMVLETKEKKYRTTKRKLSEMEESLKVLQGIKEPERVKPWTISRPSNESFILQF